MYLCHTVLRARRHGARLVLSDLHDFLAANPGEVVVIVNQDYVTPEDCVGAVRDAGLERSPTAGRRRARGRRCGEMIDTRPRLVMLAENEPAPRPGTSAPTTAPAGDAVLVPERGAAARHGEPRPHLRAEPRPGHGAAVPRQPLGDHGPAARARRTRTPSTRTGR